MTLGQEIQSGPARTFSPTTCSSLLFLQAPNPTPTPLLLGLVYGVFIIMCKLHIHPIFMKVKEQTVSYAAESPAPESHEAGAAKNIKVLLSGPVISRNSVTRLLGCLFSSRNFS
jgi:hypothetical protein